MDIPRGHAMIPLNASDFLDFIYNYFKAEYAPIRSIWSTATAEPRHHGRWINMGHELTPLTFRPANAQAQKDLASLDFFCREKDLDASFVRGIVIRFAKYEVHERLEKKLYESGRLDLMVRKALKEKHLIDALWPSPAPRDILPELLKQGVQVRQWYGDMFFKYFRVLHSLDDFKLRPEIDQRIKSIGTLNLVPFVDHLVFGTVDPILPIVAKGAGYANARAWKQRVEGRGYGSPEQFDVRFEVQGVEETVSRSVNRQCTCLKCGARRDVRVAIVVDPSPGPVTSGARRQPEVRNLAEKKRASRAAQRYSPGYVMPGSMASDEQSTSQPSRTEQHSEETRPESPPQKKPCRRCTFLNHPELTACEMCQGELSDTLVSKPPSPEARPRGPPKASSHSHSASVPAASSQDAQKDKKEGESAPARPSGPNPNRHSLSSALFSIFPFSQQHQSEHHANLPATQPSMAEVQKPKSNAPKPESGKAATTSSRPGTSKSNKSQHKKQAQGTEAETSTTNSASKQEQPDPRQHQTTTTPPPPPLVLSQSPELAMMPLTPPPMSSTAPSGLPQTLLDYDFVPVSATSPSFPNAEEAEDAGWGEVRREEVGKGKERGMEGDRGFGDEGDSSEEEGRIAEGMIDLDAVAREEMGVWGEKEDED